MPDYVLNRNYNLRTTLGHIINFKKGEPVYVPPMCEKAARAIGAMPTEGEPIDVLDDEIPQPVEMTVGERKEKIFAAFRTMEAREKRGDFTAQAVPNLQVLANMLGFDLAGKERDVLWREYKIGIEE